MSVVISLIVLHLIVLHSVDGREIHVNPVQVTSLHAATPGDTNKLLTNKVRCVVGLTDGKFVSAVESCDAVKQLLEHER